MFKHISQVCIAIAFSVWSGTVPLAFATSTVVARWDFGTEETTPLVPHGNVHRDQPGPRPPEFPSLADSNTSVKLDGEGARFSFLDPHDHSDFDFTNGDTISLEAWVKLEEIGEGQNVYVIGKGRTSFSGKNADNQNWALRLRKLGGEVRVSFLFATPRGEKSNAKDAHWHRWTSDSGFSKSNRWHHIAVSYTFGEPESIRGWIDGESQDGKWDMGGATKEPPVVDEDAVWIGSSMGGHAASSLRGWIDSVAVYRGPINDESMKSRFKRAKPLSELPPKVDTIPGTVRVTFRERMETHREWPEFYEPETASNSNDLETPDWLTNSFLQPRMPNRFDEWGIRASWQSPVLVRSIAEVELPAGKSKFLVRTRGLSRLWVGDQIVVRTKAIGGSTDGHQPVDPLPEPPLPGMRIVGYGVQESFGEIELQKPEARRVIFEAMIGGDGYRADSGEMMVGILAPGATVYQLLQPAATTSSPIPINDAAMKPALQQALDSLDKFDRVVRQQKAASQDEFWNRRHELAKEWTGKHPAPKVPQTTATKHAIDQFVAAKIEQARTALQHQSNADAIETPSQFQEQVLPLLRKHCFRCHGDKDEEGGLRLTSREAMLDGGDSGEAAVVPGNPHEGELLARIRSEDEGERMPPSMKLPEEEVAILTKWISDGAEWQVTIDASSLGPYPLVDDASFLRRVYLDTVGQPPTESDARQFLADKAPDKRSRLIDELLSDDRVADHWVSYWQDVLAENPNLLKPSLNNTGPFRWYLHDALVDNRPLDRMVTEIVMMRGSEREGGSAGFGMAADNDAPMATRGIVLASAFLGTQLQCARCHDSPYHTTKQRDLFAIAAMMSRKNVTVPETSTVSPGFFEKNSGRESLIKVTLKPGEPVEPKWPFEDFFAEDVSIDDLVNDPEDSRERLAASITSPSNQRFANVMVNRIWKRLIGAGIVEPADDWEVGMPSHPELLDWLSSELLNSGYDAKHIVRLIMNSQLYQREAKGFNRHVDPDQRYFAAPERRRLTAEQVVDSMVAASGKPLDVDELSFDPEAKRPATTMISLGSPKRSWQFATLSNERDRPSLAFPRATAVVDVLEAFGWTGSRQNAITQRDVEPNVLQPGAVANSVFTSWVTAASDQSSLANLAVESSDSKSLVEAVYLRFLSRMPAEHELNQFASILDEGFADRIVPTDERKPVEYPPMLRRVSWSNHLAEDANRVKIEMEQRAREGDPADPRLKPEWRMVFEDVVWSVVNSPEFVWVP
jgi:hypothetical protein